MAINQLGSLGHASDWEILPNKYHLILHLFLGTIFVDLSTGIIVSSTIDRVAGKYFLSLWPIDSITKPILYLP